MYSGKLFFAFPSKQSIYIKCMVKPRFQSFEEKNRVIFGKYEQLWEILIT